MTTLAALREEGERLTERADELDNRRERLLRRVIDLENDAKDYDRKLTRVLTRPDRPGNRQLKRNVVKSIRQLKGVDKVLGQSAQELREERRELNDEREANLVARAERLLAEYDLNDRERERLLESYEELTGRSYQPAYKETEAAETHEEYLADHGFQVD